MRRLLLASMLVGCATAGAPGRPDSGARDAGSDAEPGDAFAPDAEADAGVLDGGVLDVGLDAALLTPDAPIEDGDSGTADMDSGTPDTDAGSDSGMPDAGSDSGMPDAGMPDAGMPDAGMPDAGMPDAGMPDAGPVCVPRTEFCGLPADEDCDGRIDEGCGRCAVGTAPCAGSCCARAETEIAYDGEAPDIDVDARGNVYVLYSVPRSTYWSTRLARYDASTSAWSDTEIGSSEGSARAVLRLDDAGGVHILAGRDSRSLRYYYSSTGVGFPSATLLTTTYDTGGTLDLAVRDGVAHVVYTLSDSRYLDRLIYRAGGFGGGFSSETIDPLTSSHRHPRVAVDADGRPWLLYEAYSSTTTLRVAHHDGSAWSYTDIETDAVGIGREYFNHHILDVTSLGQVRVLYSHGAPSPELYLAERSSTGAWTSRRIDADLTASFDDEEDDLVFAGDGVLTYAYRGATLASRAAPLNLGHDVALRRVGSELYVAYTSDATRGLILFARLPLP